MFGLGPHIGLAANLAQAPDDGGGLQNPVGGQGKEIGGVCLEACPLRALCRCQYCRAIAGQRRQQDQRELSLPQACGEKGDCDDRCGHMCERAQDIQA